MELEDVTDSLGAAEGSIRLDASDANAELDSFASNLRRVQGQSDQTGRGLMNMSAQTQQHMTRAGTALTVFGGAMLGVLGVGANMSMNFDAQMSAVQSVTGATADQFGELREEALRLGASTSFSATESAQAMEILAKAGAPLEDILGGATEDVLNLAAAAGVEVPLAAETAAAGMNVFGVSANEMADTIAQSTNASAIDVNDWALAIKAAGPAFTNAGMGVQDMSDALVILGDAGIKGEVAGTALRNIVNGLIDPMSEGALAIQEFGVQTHNADGTMRNLRDITGDLVPAWDSMTAAQKQNIATMVAGEQGAASFITMMDAQSEAASRNADAFDEAADRQDATGTAAQQAATRINNLKGDLDALSGVIETIAITFLASLTPGLRAAAQGITSMLRRLLDLPAGVQTAIAAIMGIVGALSLVGGGILLMLPRIAETVKAFQALGIAAKLGGALSFLVSPIGLVILAIAALAIGLVLLYKHFEPFRNLVNRTAAALASFGRGAISKIANIAGKLADTFERLSTAFDFYRDRTNVVSAALMALAAVFPGLRGFISPVLDLVNRFASIFQTLTSAGVNPARAALASLGIMFPILEGFIHQIIAAGDNLVSMFRNLRDAFSQLFNGDWQGAIQSIIASFIDFYQAVGSMMLALPRLILDAFLSVDWGGIASSAVDLLTAGLRAAGRGAAGMWDWLTESVSSAFDNIWSAVQTGLAFAWDAITSLDWADFIDNIIWDTFITLLDWAMVLAGKIGDVAGFIRDAITDIDWGAILGKVGDLAGFVIDALGTVNWQLVLGKIGDLISYVITALGNVDWSLVLGTITNLIGYVVTALGNVDWGDVLGKISGLISYVVTALGNVDWGAILGKVGDIASAVIKALGSVDWIAIIGVVNDLLNPLNDALGNVDWEAILGKVSDLASRVAEALGNVNWTQVLGIIVGLANMVVAALGNVAWDAIIGTITNLQELVQSAIDAMVPDSWTLPSPQQILDGIVSAIVAAMGFGGGESDDAAEGGEPDESVDRDNDDEVDEEYIPDIPPDESGGSLNPEMVRAYNDALLTTIQTTKQLRTETDVATKAMYTAAVTNVNPITSLLQATPLTWAQPTGSALEAIRSAFATKLLAARTLTQGEMLGISSSILNSSATWAPPAASAVEAIRVAMQSRLSAARGTTQAEMGIVRSVITSETATAQSNATKALTGMQSSMSSQAKQAQASVSSEMRTTAANTSSNLDKMRMAAGVAMASLRSIMANGAAQAAAAVANGLAIIPGIISSIGGAAAGAARAVGSNIGMAMASGMLSMLGMIRAAASAMVAAAQTALHAKALISSPSRLFMRDGVDVVRGFVRGIVRRTPDAIRAARDLIDQTSGMMRDATIAASFSDYGSRVVPVGGYNAGAATTIINTWNIEQREGESGEQLGDRLLTIMSSAIASAKG